MTNTKTCLTNIKTCLSSCKKRIKQMKFIVTWWNMKDGQHILAELGACVGLVPPLLNVDNIISIGSFVKVNRLRKNMSQNLGNILSILFAISHLWFGSEFGRISCLFGKRHRAHSVILLCLRHWCCQCRISPTLPPPKVLPRAPLMVIYKKKLWYATSRGRMDFNAKYSNCRHNFGRTRLVTRFWGLGEAKYIFMGERF